jgi:hypothetical protein
MQVPIARPICASQMSPTERQSKYWCLMLEKNILHDTKFHIHLGEICENYVMYHQNEQTDFFLCFIETFKKTRLSTIKSKLKLEYLGSLYSSDKEISDYKSKVYEKIKTGDYLYIKGYQGDYIYKKESEESPATLPNALCKLLLLKRDCKSGTGFEYNGSEYIRTGITETLRVPHEYIPVYTKNESTPTSSIINPECNFKLINTGADFISEMIIYGYSLSGGNFYTDTMPLLKNRKGWSTFKPIETDDDGIVIVAKLTFQVHGLLLLDKKVDDMYIKINGHVSCVLAKCFFLDGPERKDILEIKETAKRDMLKVDVDEDESVQNW